MPLADAASYPLWINVVIFAAAAACVWVAGTRLARYVSAIGDLTGLEQAFVGMLLLGTLTSLPEIANVLTSSSFGNPALAVNNLLGSASINIVLLALADAAMGRDALRRSSSSSPDTRSHRRAMAWPSRPASVPAWSASC